MSESETRVSIDPRSSKYRRRCNFFSSEEESIIFYESFSSASRVETEPELIEFQFS